MSASGPIFVMFEMLDAQKSLARHKWWNVQYICAPAYLVYMMLLYSKPPETRFYSLLPPIRTRRLAGSGVSSLTSRP